MDRDVIDDMKILITGSNGFIGQALTSYLLAETNASLSLIIRKNVSLRHEYNLYKQRITTTTIDNLALPASYQAALVGCDVVIHLAARVHIMDEVAANPLQLYRETNVDGTLNLAREAAKAGVKRFIYLSSIKVNGEHTLPNTPFTSKDLASPKDPYGISKFEAEQGLFALSQHTPMDVVIIRPPLVYGPGVNGNFERMMRFLSRDVPLPFGALKKNKRSFVSVGNLVSFIAKCIDHPKVGNQVFLVSDNDDLSTTALFLKTRRLLVNKYPLFPVPQWMLGYAARILSKEIEFSRLTDSLQVDIKRSCDILNWAPIERVDDALEKTVNAYLGRIRCTVVNFNIATSL